MPKEKMPTKHASSAARSVIFVVSAAFASAYVAAVLDLAAMSVAFVGDSVTALDAAVAAAFRFASDALSLVRISLQGRAGVHGASIV